jgi:hypothetical protein
MRAVALPVAIGVAFSAMIAGATGASAQVKANPGQPQQNFVIEKGSQGSVSVGTSIEQNSQNKATVKSVGVGATSGNNSGSVYATTTGQVGVTAGKGNFSGGVETGKQGTSGGVFYSVPLGNTFK